MKTRQTPVDDLVGLADMVRLLECRDGFALQPGVEEALRRLTENPGRPLFLTQPGRVAVVVDDGVILRHAKAGKKAGMVIKRASGSGSWVTMGGTLSIASATPRGRFVDARDPVPELGGRAGVLMLLAQRWKCLSSGQQLDARMFHDGGQVAMLASDAAELFGFGLVEATAPAEVSKPALALVTGVSAGIDATELRTKIDAHQPAAKNGRRWVDRDAALLEMLRQYNERMQLPGADSKTAEEKIGTLWNRQTNTVHTDLTAARKIKAARAAAACEVSDKRTAA